jgi:hypothetical protein
MSKSSSRSDPFEFEFELDIGDDALPPQPAEAKDPKDTPVNEPDGDYVILKRKAKKNLTEPIQSDQVDTLPKESKGHFKPKKIDGSAVDRVPARREPPVRERARQAERPGLEGIGRTKDSRNRLTGSGKRVMSQAMVSLRQALAAHGGLAGLSRNKAVIAVVLTVVVLTVGILSIAMWMLFSGEEQQHPELPGPVVGDKVVAVPANPVNEVAPVAEQGADLLKAQGGESDQQRNFRARDTLAKFFGSGSPSEIVSFIRDPQRVQPLLEDYYARYAFVMPALKETSRFQEIMINLKVFLVADIVLEGRGATTVVLQDAGKGFVVDWETYVCYNPVDWDEFYKKRPGQAFPMRVLATLDHNPGFAFPGEAEWVCVRVIGRDSDEELYGYAPAGSRTALRLREMLEDEWEFPCILQLQFPEDGKGGDRQVHIRELVMENWIKVD